MLRRFGIPVAMLCVSIACGCGRFAFVPQDLTGADATTELRSGPCLRDQVIPAMAKIVGETFEYIDYNNNTRPLGMSDIAAVELDFTTVISAATSDAAGSYALEVPLAGVARRATIRYARGGYWSTWIVSDRPFDRDVSGPNAQHWRLGDGPLWTDGAMGAVYSTLGASLDPSKGFLSVSARDCDDAIVEGVSFDITPRPDTSAYLGANGLPAGGAMSTLAPYAQLVAFNVQPGLTQIRATKAGLVFLELEVMVRAGMNATYTVVHPLD